MLLRNALRRYHLTPTQQTAAVWRLLAAGAAWLDQLEAVVAAVWSEIAT